MVKLSQAAVSVYDAFYTSAPDMNLLHYVLIVAIAVGALRYEVTRRTSKSPLQGGSRSSRLKKSYDQYLPEIIALLFCVALAVILRTHGVMATVKNAMDEVVLTKIVRTWPLLLSADSLLGFQAMLRLLAYASSALRISEGPTLVSQEFAAISCAAAVGRTLLVASNRIFMLDGPLGGSLPALIDLVSVPLLAFLARGIDKKSLAAAVLAISMAVFVGSQDRLKLADNRFSDGLFIFVHTAEFFAAFAYLSRALISESGVTTVGRENVALWFAHIIMPVQASLAAYFFVECFKYVPQVVGAGYPFEILHIGGVAAAGAYAGASVIYFCNSYESPAKENIELCHSLHLSTGGPTDYSALMVV